MCESVFDYELSFAQTQNFTSYYQETVVKRELPQSESSYRDNAASG